MRQATNEAARESRAQGVRAAKKVRETEDAPWTPPSSLEAPPPRAGMVQRWIRVSSQGKDDPINSARKFREGWAPRPADTVSTDWPVPKISGGKFAGFIGVEGMVLCEMPEKRNNQRKQFIADKIEKNTRAIDAQIRQTNKENKNPAFGRIEKSDRTIPIREVKVQEDEEQDA